SSYTPSQGGGVPSGVDHQTIGGGPFHTPVPTGVSPLYPNAVYYCSQELVTAFCALSVDGGVTFGPGVPIYNLTQCGGIHGHVKVAPDGTVYVPNASCLGGQGVAVSEDNGTTWTVRPVRGTAINGSPFQSAPSQGLVDPSLGIAKDGTVYFGYQNGDGTAHIAVSHDRGQTWVNDQDVGSIINLQNVTFPEVVAGDAKRAAFAFLGTTTAGNYQDFNNFHGVWHLYIATTYDGGKSYHTVDATPDDPVQRGSICNLGTTACGAHPINDRNLLDFMDITIDSHGREQVSYPDGCITTACINGGPNDYTAKATIARQSGGKGLFAQFDTTEPKAPAAPRVENLFRLSPTSVRLLWSEPDNGGSPITGYNIYRGTKSGGETLLTTIPNAAFYNPSTESYTVNYTDSTIAPNTQYFYRITAVNAQGEGHFCNEYRTGNALAPPTSSTTFSCDGQNVVTDPAGDAIDPAAGSAGGNTDQVDILAVSFSTDATAKTLTTTMTLKNLTNPPVPIAGTNDTYYYVVWTGADGKMYATLAAEPDPTGNFAFSYGEFNPGNNQLSTSNAATGSITAGANGTISVTVPLSGVGNPAIPVTAGQTPAVNNPYALTFSGEGALGTGLIFIAADDRAPNVGFGSSWAVCPAPPPPPADTAPRAQLTATPLKGVAPLTVNFDASNSSTSDGDTITAYRFDFGDGSQPVIQSSPVVSHTYTNPGDYRATLAVQDSGGTNSVNVADRFIEAQVGHVYGTGALDPAGNYTFSFNLQADLTGFLNFKDKRRGLAFQSSSVTQYLSSGRSDAGCAQVHGDGTLQDNSSVKYYVKACSDDTNGDTLLFQLNNQAGQVIYTRTARIAAGDIELVK
ncbi:MAG: PKD domain-containing protein, partial [Verrucomicrobia bacterium]|nr:PKD domain-containing protein [Verrucomicrobiota bacterium]